LSRFEEVLAGFQACLNTLPDKPEESARTTLAALWQFAQGQAVSARAARVEACQPLSAPQDERLQELIARRLAGEPLAYITGRQQFMNLQMLAEPGALIPRRETEILAGAAIGLAAQAAQDGVVPLVIDVCTGSGNVALAVAHHVPSALVLAADLSGEAVDAARRNADLLELQGRVDFRVGDLLAPFDPAQFAASVDVLTCNPPYISSGRLETMPSEIIAHEPRLAFNGGPLGVQILNRIVREAPAYLKPGGYLVVEVGKGQGPSMQRRLGSSPDFAESRGIGDDAGEIRVVVARRR